MYYNEGDRIKEHAKCEGFGTMPQNIKTVPINSMGYRVQQGFSHFQWFSGALLHHKAGQTEFIVYCHHLHGFSEFLSDSDTIQ